MHYMISCADDVDSMQEERSPSIKVRKQRYREAVLVASFWLSFWFLLYERGTFHGNVFVNLPWKAIR